LVTAEKSREKDIRDTQYAYGDKEVHDKKCGENV
jgi:hypothetical protein